MTLARNIVAPWRWS